MEPASAYTNDEWERVTREEDLDYTEVRAENSCRKLLEIIEQEIMES